MVFTVPGVSIFQCFCVCRSRFFFLSFVRAVYTWHRLTRHFYGTRASSNIAGPTAERTHCSCCCVYVCTPARVLFFLHPIYYPRTTLSLPPSGRSSDPRSHSGPSSPLPTAVRAFIFIARRILHVLLPLSTRVQLHLPTLLGALSCQLILFLHFCKYSQDLRT